jgi:hypothetical protein
MFVSWHQNTGLAKFKYLKTTETNQNYTPGKVKRRLNSGNPYCSSFWVRSFSCQPKEE